MLRQYKQGTRRHKAADIPTGGIIVLEIRQYSLPDKKSAHLKER